MIQTWTSCLFCPYDAPIKNRIILVARKVCLLPKLPACRSECSDLARSCRKNLMLAKYCGSICQRAHWSYHKTICKSSLNKANWIPAWDREDRMPAWATGEAAKSLHNPFGSSKYLWGNVPSIDIGQIHKNEGRTFGEDLAFLFAGEPIMSQRSYDCG